MAGKPTGDGKFALRLLNFMLQSRGEVIPDGTYSWETQGNTSLAAVEFVFGVKRNGGRWNRAIGGLKCQVKMLGPHPGCTTWRRESRREFKHYIRWSSFFA